MAENPSTPPITTKRASSKGRVLAWTVIVLVIGLVAVAAGFFLGRGTDSKPKANGAASTSSSSDAQPAGPNGCVGGKDPSTAISTAFDEPITKRGAIQFIGTTLRWLNTTDTDREQLDSVGPKLVAKEPLEHYKAVNESGSSANKFTYTTEHAKAWVSSFDAKEGTATVVFYGEAVKETPAEVTTLELPHVVYLTKSDSHWMIKEASPGSYGEGEAARKKMLADLEANGVALVGGC